MQCQLVKVPSVNPAHGIGFVCQPEWNSCFIYTAIYALYHDGEPKGDVDIELRDRAYDTTIRIIGTNLLLRKYNDASDGQLAAGYDPRTDKSIKEIIDISDLSPRLIEFCRETNDRIVQAESSGISLGQYLDMMSDIGHKIVDHIGYDGSLVNGRIRGFIGQLWRMEVLDDVIDDVGVDLQDRQSGKPIYNPLVIGLGSGAYCDETALASARLQLEQGLRTLDGYLPRCFGTFHIKVLRTMLSGLESCSVLLE